MPSSRQLCYETNIITSNHMFWQSVPQWNPPIGDQPRPYLEPSVLSLQSFDVQLAGVSLEYIKAVKAWSVSGAFHWIWPSAKDWPLRESIKVMEHDIMAISKARDLGLTVKNKFKLFRKRVSAANTAPGRGHHKTAPEVLCLSQGAITTERHKPPRKCTEDSLQGDCWPKAQSCNERLHDLGTFSSQTPTQARWSYWDDHNSELSFRHKS